MPQSEFAKYVTLFEPVMKGMREILGDRSEFILHDLSAPYNSVAAVEGNVTKRDIGAPSTNVVIDAIKKYGDDAKDMIGYRSVAKDGRVLKSSTIFIRDEEGHIVGCFCYNIDLTDFCVAENIIKSFCNLSPIDADEKSVQEVFAQDVTEVVDVIINSEISAFGKPVPMMTRTDKLQLVSILDGKGVFGVKGAPETVAHFLGTSVFTIYNYLKEIRNNHKTVAAKGETVSAKG